MIPALFSPRAVPLRSPASPPADPQASGAGLSGRQQAGASASAVEPGRSLSTRLIQEQLGSARLSLHSLTSVEEPDLGNTVDELCFSPDNRFLALSFCLGRVGDLTATPFRCRIYSLEEGQLRQVYQGGHGQPLRGLHFGANSRSLHAVDGAGQLHEWRPQDNGRWKVQEAISLCPPAANQVLLSPGGDQLAVVDDGRDAANFHSLVRQPVLSVLGLTAAGDWSLQYQWRCPRSFLHTNCYKLAPVSFSDDSQVLLFTAAPHVFICQRSHDLWTLQSPDAVCDAVDEAPQLAPDGKALALFVRHEGQVFPTVRRTEIELWQPDQQRQWQMTGTYACGTALFCGSCAMAFSPDSQQLVFPDATGQQSGRLCLLQRSATGTFEKSASLEFPAGSTGSGFGALSANALRWNATGTRLMAEVAGGLQLWCRGSQSADWVAAGWLTEAGTRDNSQGQLLGFGIGGDVHEGGNASFSGQFSPDGVHCALFDTWQGHCSIWGPDSSGQYRRQVSVWQGAGLARGQFTADGSQVLLAFRGGLFGPQKGPSGLACLSLVPESEDQAGATDQEIDKA